jgi:hypothetical protein
MLSTLGPWPGGVKPTPFGCDPDSVAPSVSILSPANNARVAGTFDVSVRATDDCAVKSVSVKVSPMGLQTSSSSPPFTWTLTQIRGQQTITVTASDASGKTTSTSIVVNAPGSDGGVAGTTTDAGTTDAKATDAGKADAQTPDTAGPHDGGDTAAASGGSAGGCDVAGGTSGAAFAALLMTALLFASLRRAPVRARQSRPSRRA